MLNDSMELKNRILEAIQVSLETSPLSKFQGTSLESFDDLLRPKLQYLYEILLCDSNSAKIDIDDSDVRWSFTQGCLECLKLLSMALNDGNKSIDELLSIKEQKNISTLMQLIVSIGLVPNLMPVLSDQELNSRSKFAFLIEVNISDPLKKYSRLVYVTERLVSLCDNSCSSLSSLIYGHIMYDLLLALLQLSFAPLVKPNIKTPSSNEEFVMTESVFECLSIDQLRFRQLLRSHFLDRIYQPLVVKHLLSIQSGNGRRLRWLRKSCGQLLSECLMKSTSGVSNVIRGVLDVSLACSSPTGYAQLIASVISSPPAKMYSDVEKYYQLICPQLLDITGMKDGDENKSFHQIACVCIRSLSERSLILSRRYLFEPLMAPLLALTKTSSKQEKLVLLDEASLNKCVDHLYTIFVWGHDPSSMLFASYLSPIILVLLELHCCVTFGIWYLKNHVTELIQLFLKYTYESEALATLRAFAFISEHELPSLGDNVCFTPGDSGGFMAITRSEGSEETNFLVCDDERSIVIVDMITQCKVKELSVKFFLSVLKDLGRVMMFDNTDTESSKCISANQNLETRLNDLDADFKITLVTLRRNMMVIRLLGLMCEDEVLLETLQNDAEYVHEFTMLSLERAATSVNNGVKIKNDDSGSDLIQTQGLNMALTLLSMKLIGNSSPNLDEWNRLRDSTSPHLDTLSRWHPDEKVRSTSRRLYRLILTHGIISDCASDIKSRANDISKTTQKMNLLMDQFKGGQAFVNSDMTSFEQALNDLTDPLLPVRGHALIAITRLIDEKDPVAIKNTERCVEIFQNSMEDEDTYIYLSAINGLVACANLLPDRVVPFLTSKFVQSDQAPNKGNVEIRTKFGEALVKVSRILGPTTVKYKTLLLNSFLSKENIHHPEPLIRASCLSNLAEVCKNLKFALGNEIHHIFAVIENAIRYDKEPKVRRASVLALTLLLQGVGRDAFSLLADIMKDIYRSLKALNRLDQDDVVRSHVALALDEIDKITKEYIFPQRKLIKHIYVIDEPPN